MSNQSRSPLTPVELAKRAQVFTASRAVETNICRRYWKYGRSLWQEDIDRFLARGIDIRSLAYPLPVSRAGVIWTKQGFIFEASTERDDGEDAYLVPVAGGVHRYS